MFQKTLVELNEQPSKKEKRKSLLHAIGGGWYVKRLGQKVPSPKKRKLSKKPKKNSRME